MADIVENFSKRLTSFKTDAFLNSWKQLLDDRINISWKGKQTVERYEPGPRPRQHQQTRVVTQLMSRSRSSHIRN